METTEKNMEHGEHFNESIVNEVILEDMKKNRIDHMKYLPGMEVLEESDVMDQVISAMNAYDYDKYTEADVRRALAHDNRTPEDFQALLSPAALPLLEEINYGLGAEYVYNDKFALRAGYHHESQSKGNRKYFTVGAGFKMNVFSLDAAYVVATAKSNPLDQTLRFTLSFDMDGLKDLFKR